MQKFIVSTLLVFSCFLAKAQNYILIDGRVYQLLEVNTSYNSTPNYSTPAPNNNVSLNGFNNTNPSFSNTTPNFNNTSQLQLLNSNFNNGFFTDQSVKLQEMNQRLTNIRQGIQVVNDIAYLASNFYNIGGGIYNNTTSTFQPVQFTAW